MRYSRLLAILATALGSTLYMASAFSDEPTRIFDACGPDERVRYSEKFPEEPRAMANDALSSKSGPEIFKAGFHLAQSKTSWEVRELGDFLKARAYFGEGLIHLAYERFMSMLVQPLQPGVHIAARLGAVQCIIRIQQDFPTLSIGRAVGSNLISWIRRSDLDSDGKAEFGRALVVRMKEVVNSWDEREAIDIIGALGSIKGYALYGQALAAQRNAQYGKAITLWERLIEKGELPSAFNRDRDTLLILYARDLYEAKQFEKAANILRMVPRDSNYLAQALSELSWALLQSGKRKEAIGAAFNIQKSLLTRVYAPEAPLVASISLHEMCQYSRALKNSVFFKKKYYPVLIWYSKLSQQQKEKPYQLLTTALRKKGGVPNLVLLEWLRSPEYRAFQLEANLLFDEKKIAYVHYSERVNTEKGAQWAKEWKAPLPRFYNDVAVRQKEIGKNMNTVLTYLTNRIAKQVAKITENVQLLEVEIFDHAGEDMVWHNVNPEYQAWLDTQKPASRAKDHYWEWGSMPTDPKIVNEIWEDEIGWTVGSVQDECKNKEKYRQEKFGGKPGNPPQATAPATSGAGSTQ